MVLIAAGAVPPRVVEGATDWAAWITAISTGVLAVGVLVAVFGFWDAKRTRHGQLITDLSIRWEEQPIVDGLKLLGREQDAEIEALVKRLFAGGPPNDADLNLYNVMLPVTNLIETIGVLANEHVLTKRVIYKMWGPTIVNVWAAWRLATAEIRTAQALQANVVYTYFEWVAGAMEKRYRRAVRRQRFFAVVFRRAA
jgi:hypothetical protein